MSVPVAAKIRPTARVIATLDVVNEGTVGAAFTCGRHGADKTGEESFATGRTTGGPNQQRRAWPLREGRFCPGARALPAMGVVDVYIAKPRKRL
jgi:hypothetical protein